MSGSPYTEPTRKKIWGLHPNVFFLGIVSFFTDISSEMIFTLVPLFVVNVLKETAMVVGLIGGAPAILGAWLGAFSPSPTLTVLFLAIGTGAVFEVVYEIAKLVQKDTARQPMPMTVFAGIMTGMLLLWVTGMLVK